MKYVLDKFFERTKGFYPFFKYCPNKYKFHYLTRKASETLGYGYNYLEPKTFNEKVRWLIYNEKLKIKSILTDKIKVKTYINEKLGEGHCASVYGAWDNFDDIDFYYLPNKFVLKTNHAWETNLFIFNRHEAIKNKKLRKTVNDMLKIHYEDYSLEPQYRYITPKVFAEHLLSVGDKQEFQVHCFNGVPYMTEAMSIEHGIMSFGFYDTQWKKLPYKLKGYEEKDFSKPIVHEQLLEYAQILAEGFSYVRVDFLVIKNDIYVLEMTFTPHSAMMPFENTLHDLELGKLIKI